MPRSRSQPEAEARMVPGRGPNRTWMATMSDSETSAASRRALPELEMAIPGPKSLSTAGPGPAEGTVVPARRRDRDPVP
jgi:hypothetical protein